MLVMWAVFRFVVAGAPQTRVAGERTVYAEDRPPPPVEATPQPDTPPETPVEPPPPIEPPPLTPPRTPVPEPLPPPAAEAPAGKGLVIPVVGITREALRDSFNEKRGSIPHRALDVNAPQGTPVVAVDDGRVRKLFESEKGGITLYQFNPQETLCYYYAHLERYAPGIVEGMALKAGDLIGFVGMSGNAKTPHLHFEITRLGPDKKWWGGEPINPYPLLLREARAR